MLYFKGVIMELRVKLTGCTMASVLKLTVSVFQVHFSLYFEKSLMLNHPSQQLRCTFIRKGYN